MILIILMELFIIFLLIINRDYIIVFSISPILTAVSYCCAWQLIFRLSKKDFLIIKKSKYVIKLLKNKQEGKSIHK